MFGVGRGSAGSLIALGGVQDEVAEEFASGGVDHSDVQVLDEQEDAGSGVGSANPDAVEPPGVAQGDLAGGVDAVDSDPVVAVAGAVAGAGLGPVLVTQKDATSNLGRFTGRVPLYAHVATEDGRRGLQVALGRDYSTLEYHDASDPANPQLAVSRGTVTVPAEDEFDLGGTPTSVRPGSGIPVEDARKAAREFFEIGSMPTCVEWRPVA